MMQPPTMQEEGGRYSFAWGDAYEIEIRNIKRLRFGDEVDVRVLDQSQGDSPVIASATVRLGDLRERQRFCQSIVSRDGKVPDWDARFMVVADYISQQVPTASNATPVTVILKDVEREEVAWLARGRLARRKLHMMDGDPGVGKTFVSDAIVAAVTTGNPLFGEGERREPAKALMLTAEDDLGDTVRPRIEDMGGDLSRVTILTGVRKENGEERHLSLVDDLTAVDTVLSKGGFDVVVIDPINAYLGAELDTNRDAALRSVLTPIAALAMKHQVAIICIRHLTKGGRDRPIYRGQGSIAYTAAARIVMIVGKNPDNEEERVIVWIKVTNGADPSAIAFSLTEGQFRWLGETDVTASALLAPEKGTEERSKLDEARAFLEDTLADGPVSTPDVEKQAAMAGISSGTLRRAKASLGVQADAVRAEGEKGVRMWTWGLPAGLGHQGDQPREDEALSPELDLEQADNEALAEGADLLHSGAPEPEQSPSDTDEKAERALCLGSAKALDYPEIELGPGENIGPGEASWQLSVQKNGMDVIKAAQAALDRLGEV